MLDKLFALTERQTDVRTEILAGLTTFMTMAYILFLAPSLLSLAGMDKDAVLIATALAGGLVTIAMGVFVNYPICLAPGVGMLAFYSFTVVLGMGIPWQTALGAVFISGIVFLILTVTSVRQMIVEGIPTSMKNAITVGIGLFITIIGLKLSGLMAIRLSLTPGSLQEAGITHGNFIPTAEETILQLGALNNPEHLLALFGLIFTAVLIARKVPGGMLLGIFGTSIVGYLTGVCHLPEHFSLVAIPDFSHTALLQLNIGDAFSMGLVTIIFTFTFVELFDSMGTMIGTATKAGILDPESGKFPGLSRAFFTDACGVSIGAMLGTSTVTAFVESAAGVGAGGKTGLTAVTCGVCFLLSLIFAPFMMLIPEAATSPVLIIVGVFMMEQIHTIDFTDFSEGFPAFMVIVLMPFTYNIANGVSAGLILYPLLKILTGKAKDLHWIMYVLAAIVIARYLFLNN